MAGGEDNFQEQIRDKERRKLKARLQKKASVWRGFSVFGLIGWSVAIPTLLLLMIGVWLDDHYHTARSYTLILLVAGLCLGCLNAWYWLDRKWKELQEEEEERPNDE